MSREQGSAGPTPGIAKRGLDPQALRQTAQVLSALAETIEAEGSNEGLNGEREEGIFQWAPGSGERRTKPPLPAPEWIRDHIRKRRLRSKLIDDGLFADPAWDMLLDLVAAAGERKRVSVTSLCLASEVAPTTALRWTALMVRMGLLVREEDVVDKRRTFVSLSDKATAALAVYFEAIGKSW